MELSGNKVNKFGAGFFPADKSHHCCPFFQAALKRGKKRQNVAILVVWRGFAPPLDGASQNTKRFARRPHATLSEILIS
jgi:hypothetical protein